MGMFDCVFGFEVVIEMVVIYDLFEDEDGEGFDWFGLVFVVGNG